MAMAESIIHPIEIKELLWINPSPGAVMTTTTISLSLSGYKFIELWYQENGYTNYKTVILPIGIDTYIFGAAGTTNARQVITTTSSIKFMTGITYGAYGGNSASNNGGIIIPYRIYGIK